MRLVVLGSAAGGGYPQWNCRCPVCDLYWSNDPRVRRRTQASLAVSVEGRDWALLNCSPDIREQIAITPALSPLGLRQSPIKAVVLTGGEIDQIGGLLSLREGAPLDVYGSAEVISSIRRNEVFSVLDPSLVRLVAIRAGLPFQPLPGLDAVAFEVPGKPPLYREEEEGHGTVRSAHALGLLVRSEAGGDFGFVPNCADIDERLCRDLASCSTLFFDGTVWTDGELVAAGVGRKTGRRMGHVEVSGPDGSMERLQLAGAARRIYIHINNTNPLLIEGSPQRREAEARGWEIAHDGMELLL